MKKLFENKQFVLFLILTVVVYSFSIQTAMAGDFFDDVDDIINDVGDMGRDTASSVFNSIVSIGSYVFNPIVSIGSYVFDPIVSIGNYVFNSIISIGNAALPSYTVSEIVSTIYNTYITANFVGNVSFNYIYGATQWTTGTVLGIDWLVNEGGCRFGNPEKNAMGFNTSVICPAAGGGVVAIPTQDLGCIYRQKEFFYDSVRTCIASQPVCISYDSSGECTKTSWSSYGNPSPSGRKVAVYRFTMPVGGGDLTDWFVNQIKNKIGAGVIGEGGGIGAPSYWPDNNFAVVSDEKIAEVDYDIMCPQGVCIYDDIAVPENSYVAYAMKILGPEYGTYETTQDENGYYVNNCVSRDNKFMAPKNTPYVKFNYDFGDSNAYGFSGPYKTDACPLPTVDLKINNSDGPLNLYLPDSGAVLSWTSQYASSCVVSGDWSGNKPVFGSEDLGGLSRGTANPGGGKTYQFSITCDSVKGSATDSVSATVFEYPVCSFGANPPVIELPNSSQLSQTCSYADSCSINQRVGTVCSGESDCAADSSNVRPAATTTFILTCQGLDGSQSWQTTVGIGQPGSVKYEEVTPQ